LGCCSGSGRFPVQQALGALEVIEDYPVDTIRDNDKRLFKQYGITI
jgi:hypothetical protein